MRIISQDSMIDIPYEHMIISIDYTTKNQIIAEGAHANGNNTKFPIAKYSTEYSAKKAMKMLRREWEHCGTDGCFQFPMEDELPN